MKENTGGNEWLDKANIMTGVESDPICHSAGCTQYLHPKADDKDKWPMNYFVPSFGKDRTDVLPTWNSLDVAERQLGHVWNFNPDDEKKKDDPVQYNFAPELDDNMIITNNNMKDAEKRLGKWNYEALQLDSEAEEASYNKMQLEFLSMQHHQHKHHKHQVPHALAQSRVASDPIFASDFTYPIEHEFDEDGRKIVEYPDPDQQGLEQDIKDTQHNLGVSEKYWGTKWKYDFKEDMPQFAIPGKPQYTGEPYVNFKRFIPGQ